LALDSWGKGDSGDKLKGLILVKFPWQSAF